MTSKFIQRLLLLATTMFFLANHNAAANSISVSTKPLHSLVAAIIGKQTSVELIIDGFRSIHHLSMKPSTIRKLHRAKTVIWMGAGIEPFIESSLEAVPTNIEIHDLSTHLINQDIHWWTNPQQAALLIGPLTEIIIKSDPENRSKYQSNAKELFQRLGELRLEIRNSLAQFSHIRFLTLHNAYDGFNSSFGLTGGKAIEHNGAVGAKTIAGLRNELLHTNIPCVFGEAGENSAILKALIEGTKARTGMLDAMGNNLAAGPQFYENLIRQISDTYLTCFKKK